MNDLGRLGSFGLAAAAAFALTVSAFITSFHSARLGVVLLVIFVMHLVRFARVVFAREALIYGGFLGYMLLELLWTEDRLLALNTLVPAANFVIVMTLFASLALLKSIGVEAKTHEGLLTSIALHFVKPGKLSAGTSRRLKHLEGDREIADYDFVTVMTEADATSTIVEAQAYVDEVVALLGA